MKLKTIFFFATAWLLYQIGYSQAISNRSDYPSFFQLKDSLPVEDKYYQTQTFQNGYDAFKNQNFEKGIRNFNSCLVLNQFNENAIYNRALCYYKMSDFKNCCLDFEYLA